MKTKENALKEQAKKNPIYKPEWKELINFIEKFPLKGEESSTFTWEEIAKIMRMSDMDEVKKQTAIAKRELERKGIILRNLHDAGYFIADSDDNVGAMEDRKNKLERQLGMMHGIRQMADFTNLSKEGAEAFNKITDVMTAYEHVRRNKGIIPAKSSRKLIVRND
jgi:hypothetical protein